MRYKPMQPLQEPAASVVIPRLLIALAASGATMIAAPSLTHEFTSLIRAPTGSPIAWSVFFGIAATWLAYGYGWARASGKASLWRHLITLLAPIGIIAVANGAHLVGGFVLSIGWMAWATWMAWTLAKHDPLAGVMALPLIGAASSTTLLLLTLTLLP